MERVVYREDIVLKDKWLARRELENYREVLKISVFLLPFCMVLPPLSLALLFYLLYLYFKLSSEYLLKKKPHYEKLFSPKMSWSHFIKVGYEVPTDKLTQHLNHLHFLSSEHPVKKEQAKRYLKAQESRVKHLESYREVGFSKTQLTTHFWLIGTTGAGKTSLIMQLIKEQAKNGGGVIFVDGKADMKMFFKLYNVMKDVGREHDVYLVNFLPVAKNKEHTNTFNPIAGMPALQVVEFLMALMGEATGDQAYWQGRGRAMLLPIVRALDFRKTFYGEEYTLSVLADYVSDIQKYTFLASFITATLSAYEESLREKEGLEELIISKGKLVKGILDDKYPYVDVITYYFTVYPQEKYLLERFGVSYEYAKALYSAYRDISGYIKEITNEWWKVVSSTADAFVERFGKGLLELSMEQALAFWSSLVSSFPKAYIFDTAKYQDAVQQHSYGQQQWTKIFSALLAYDNIFGSLEPEVDLLDAIRNQKIVYFLLPPLKQSADTTALLGKLILSASRIAISYALGSAVEGLTKEQRAVLTARLTPIPLGLFILDEYGAYPIRGLDTILAQVRSINVSTIISTQDITSARAEGTDENSLKRIFANTQKVVLRALDKELFDFISPFLEGYKQLASSFLVDPETGYTFQKPEFSTEKGKVVDERVITAFKNGFALILTDDEPVLTQIYWADAEETDVLYLNKSTRF